MSPAEPSADWTFLTNHAHVLMSVAGNPDATTREIAAVVGITERAVQRIVAELERDGYLSHERRGRGNHYRVNARGRLRHPMDREHRVGELLSLLGAGGRA
jgi:DNA-binding MarR family transcriptional regulator